jgi:hypothetical protein
LNPEQRPILIAHLHRACSFAGGINSGNGAILLQGVNWPEKEQKHISRWNSLM